MSRARSCCRGARVGGCVLAQPGTRAARLLSRNRRATRRRDRFRQRPRVHRRSGTGSSFADHLAQLVDRPVCVLGVVLVEHALEPVPVDGPAGHALVVAHVARLGGQQRRPVLRARRPKLIGWDAHNACDRYARARVGLGAEIVLDPAPRGRRDDTAGQGRCLCQAEPTGSAGLSNALSSGHTENVRARSDGRTRKATAPPASLRR
jgi:hypothetical protein